MGESCFFTLLGQESGRSGSGTVSGLFRLLRLKPATPEGSAKDLRGPESASPTPPPAGPPRGSREGRDCDTPRMARRCRRGWTPPRGPGAPRPSAPRPSLGHGGVRSTGEIPPLRPPPSSARPHTSPRGAVARRPDLWVRHLSWSESSGADPGAGLERRGRSGETGTANAGGTGAPVPYPPGAV